VGGLIGHCPPNRGERSTPLILAVTKLVACVLLRRVHAWANEMFWTEMNWIASSFALYTVTVTTARATELSSVQFCRFVVHAFNARRIVAVCLHCIINNKATYYHCNYFILWLTYEAAQFWRFRFWLDNKLYITEYLFLFAYSICRFNFITDIRNWSKTLQL